MDASWDRETDVVVMGYGYSGGIAAIVAHDLGARVMLLEKMEHPGGNSILSGGFFRITDDVDKAFAYLKRMCLNTVPDPVIHTFARELHTLSGFMKELTDQTEIQVQERHGTGGTYRFDGGPPGDAIGLLAVKSEEAQCYPWLQVHGTGWIAFKVVDDNVSKRGIDVSLSTPVRELISDEQGRAVGVVAESGGKTLRVRARKGVVLAAGGFEHNERLRLQYLQAQPFHPICAPGNTGDGLLMGQKAGAGLWHMWHVHGGYGFKAPEYPIAFRHRIQGRHGANHLPKPGEEFSLKSGDEGPKMMPWIVVDKFGKRYMDEYPPAPQDSPWRDMSLYDVHVKDFPRIPSHMIFDENGRITGPMFTPISDHPSRRYEWSVDNSAELAKGWIKQASTIEGLARVIGVPEENLAATVARWNEICDREEDTDFRRFAGSLFPIFKPPFYAVEVWPVITNTQGALAHDQDQRVLDAHDQPIPGLYCAGEMGGVFGHLYLNSGNNSEAFITGMIAGRHIAGRTGRRMSVLVTGGTGFVGIHVTAQLAESGESVVAFSAEGELDDAARDLLGPARERVTCVKGDVLDLQSLLAALDHHGADRIIHGAAVTAIGDLEPDAARQAALVNVGGTATVLEAARLAEVKRFVHLSSASVYGAADPRVPLDEESPIEPNGIYGITKRAGEDIVRRYIELFGMDGVILRLSAPYGPLERPNRLRTVMSPVFHWCRAALNGDEVELADDLERDLTYVSDTARCVVLAFQSPKLRHDVYNASCGESLRFSDILAVLARVRPGFRFRLKGGGELSPFFRDSLRGPLFMERARTDLGFVPRYDIESGLSHYLDWLATHPI